MTRVTVLAALIGTIGSGLAASATAQVASNPEVFLVPLNVRGAAIGIGTPVNITNRPGYDNQPAFTADGRSIVYTSTREDEQADIYRYFIGTKKTDRITRTAPESEYSAAELRTRGTFSVIRVERDSTQRLWTVSANGATEVLFPRIKPVGYHAWIDDRLAALFVLGSPNALVLADRRTERADTLARNIGRSLVPLPAGNGFSFFARSGQQWVLTVVHSKAGKVAYIAPLIAVPAGMDYVGWIGKTAIGGTGSKLMTWSPGSTAWKEVADLSTHGITRISRIAVSRDLKHLAIVAEPAR